MAADLPWEAALRKAPVESAVQHWRTLIPMVPNLSMGMQSIKQYNGSDKRLHTQQPLDIVHDDDTQRALITISEHFADGCHFLVLVETDHVVRGN